MSNTTALAMNDQELQDRAVKAFEESEHSLRSLSGSLDCAVSSLHEALNTSTGRLRKLRMRALKELEGGDFKVRTTIHWTQPS